MRPVSAAASGYYRRCFALGDAYARFVVQQLRDAGTNVSIVEGFANQLVYGDTTIGLEVKFDRRYHETGNLCIEMAARCSPQSALELVPEGICRDDRCVWYGIGDYRILFVFRKAALRDLAAWPSLRRYRTPTSAGFLLPESAARVSAARILEWTQNEWDAARSPFRR